MISRPTSPPQARGGIVGHDGPMTIHSGHPFLPPDDARSPLRRLRSRLPAPVSVWTAGVGPSAAGWTLSSWLLADGEPGEVVGLVDADADLADRIRETGRWCVNVLPAGAGFVAEVFAGLAPSPGGMFRTGSWQPGDCGPRLDTAAGWVEADLVAAEPCGWGLLTRGIVRTVTLSDAAPLLHARGRYRTLDEA